MGANKLRPKEDTKRFRFRKERGFQSQTKKPKSCVCCNKDDHRSPDCKEAKTTEKRKNFLAKNKLCYNSTGNRHTAAKCKSLVACQVFAGHHHTSICEKRQGNFLEATVSGQIIHQTVLTDVDGIRCRAIFDTGTSTSYMHNQA